jgi:sugar/nucleoside kinase (ribokinase family)
MTAGCHRLGLKSALLTASGEDLVGDFVVHFLKKVGGSRSRDRLKRG